MAEQPKQTKSLSDSARLVQEIEARLQEITSGPWQVIEDRYEDDGKSGKLTDTVAQRRIFTAWDHPQMKGPIGVVNGFITIGKVLGQSPYHGVSISAEDARFIVDAERLLRAALTQLRASAEQLQALNDFLESCLCGECGGSGRTDNHVTGEVECGSCEGTGHDSRKAFEQLAAAAEREGRLRAALVGVSSTGQGVPCWCDGSHDIMDYGHQVKCRVAGAALQPAREPETREEKA